MLAVPLFHVHPDADHLHGRAGHLHGGIVHTVMSPDLECESRLSRAADSHDVVTIVARLGHRHLEIEFSLLTDSDRKSYNLFLSQAHALGSAVSLNFEPRVSQEPEVIALCSPTGLFYDLSSRGPPSFSA